MPGHAEPFHELGAVSDHINVEISFHIIRLFSEGLYSSANKAIEELVSNSFDADASCVHVALSADLGGPQASIAVIDNGTGMDDQGLKVHWIVGDSIKELNRTTARGRKTIGKFGIGKLAAYALGDRLTHISKAGGKYHSTTIDFSAIPRTAAASRRASEPPDPVTLELRTLTASEATAALSLWLPDGEGRAGLKLFGVGADETWTVAIISDLKPLATDLSLARLRWVLSTAMPLRDDFVLYLNSQTVQPSKLTVPRIGRWILGKDIASIPKPGPGEVETDTNAEVAVSEYVHWRLTDKVLGPVTGYVEVYDSPIDTGKSENLGRSNGFFVYVHGRLINPDDPGFGIDRNTLRHGTFSRFRVVVNIDRLDEELRSSRENLRDGPRLTRARELLQGLFNFARSRIEAHDQENPSERRASQRLSDSPAALTARPILRMMLDAFEGSFSPRHLTPLPRGEFDDTAALRAHVEARIEAGTGVVSEIAYEDLGTDQPIAVLDGVSGKLSINNEHPFVAHFADEFGDPKKNLPLELFATSEILLEAGLYSAGVNGSQLATVLDSRDELLRHLARATAPENSLTVAQRLLASESAKQELEQALVAAFRQLGYEAIPVGGKDTHDGLAEALLPAGEDGVNRYRVSLEAKSKEKPGAKVKKSGVEVATVARHRREANCDHAIVVGPDFETGADDLGAVMREIADDRKTNPGKTITLMRIRDLAALVRIAPLKRLNLRDLRDLFQASSPDEAAAWVATVNAREVETAPYQAIVEMVWELQRVDIDQQVEYGALKTALSMSKSLVLTKEQLRDACKALGHMAPGMFTARDDRVELNIRPEKVLAHIHDYIARAPAESG